eukprot:4270161-Pleurochrysis_carterae.AAC.3
MIPRVELDDPAAHQMMLVEPAAREHLIATQARQSGALGWTALLRVRMCVCVCVCEREGGRGGSGRGRGSWRG